MAWINLYRQKLIPNNNEFLSFPKYAVSEWGKIVISKVLFEYAKIYGG